MTLRIIVRGLLRNLGLNSFLRQQFETLDRVMRKLTHLTIAHPRSDTRIRIKELSALASCFEQSFALYVQDGKGSTEESDGTLILDTGHRRRGRLGHMVLGPWRMYRSVRNARPAVAHFHDPELIPVGLVLKASGVKVIYDVHEDLPRQILGKYWLPSWLRRPVSWVAEGVEWIAGRAFDGFVAATPTIARRFPASKTVTVQNFPILSELIASDSVPYKERPADFAYVGGLLKIRGSKEMVEAVGRVPAGSVKLRLAGRFVNPVDQIEAQSLDGWSRVDSLGWLDRMGIASLLGRVRAGLVVLHPTANYPDAYPVKMFEYMAAGIPVIASDFPLWRRIVDDAECGLLVDPLDSAAIARAMQWILDHPEEAEAMGRCGRVAVESTYDWAGEAKKLIGLYRRILERSGSSNDETNG